MSFLELIYFVKWVNDPNVWFWTSNKQDKRNLQDHFLFFSLHRGERSPLSLLTEWKISTHFKQATEHLKDWITPSVFQR